jgi:hypothetical protein
LRAHYQPDRGSDTEMNVEVIDVDEMLGVGGSDAVAPG